MWISPDRARLRVRGCLLAAACGYALGVPFAGQDRPDGDDFDAAARAGGPLYTGQPVAVMLEHARHLAGADGRPVDAVTAIAERWVDRWERDDALGGQLRPHGRPWPGPEGIPAGTPVADILLAMVPVGLLPLSSDRVAAIVRTGIPDGYGPLVREAAVVLACAVAAAYTSDTATPVDRLGFGSRLAQLAAEIRLAERVTAVAALGSLTAEDLARRMAPTQDPVMPLVPAAVAAFLRHPDNPAAVVRYAVSLNAGSAAVAGMAGAIAGARCGGTLLPAPWLRRLQGRDPITEVADALTPARSRNLELRQHRGPHAY
nr:ADP-ribosylglycohydrolase family protein [Micromonospora tarapacensis]